MGYLEIALEHLEAKSVSPEAGREGPRERCDVCELAPPGGEPADPFTRAGSGPAGFAPATDLADRLRRRWSSDPTPVVRRIGRVAVWTWGRGANDRHVNALFDLALAAEVAGAALGDRESPAVPRAAPGR